MSGSRSSTAVRVQLAAIALILLSTLGADKPRGAVPFYVVTDLGTFGTGQSAEALDINDAGQVVGRAGTRAFLWQNNAKIDLGTLGGSAAVAMGLNESGHVVGHSALTTPPTGTHAALWRNGNITDLTPELGVNEAGWATAINEAGQVAGNIGYASAFVWQNGTRTLLGGLGGAGSAASDINDNGIVVGTSGGHPFAWQAGTMKDLGVFPGDEEAGASAINNLGQIVGASGRTDPDTYETFYRAFIYENDVMTPLPVPSTDAHAGDINDAGVIVGTMRAGGGGSNFHGWVYVDGVVTNLNTRIPAGTGLHIAFAHAVNNAGQIAATALDAQGRYHAVLLTPGDGAPPAPTVSIADASVTEGNTGTRNLGFVLNVSPMSSSAITVSFSTADGTAAAGSDYDLASGTVTIPAGRTTWSINVIVRGDRKREPDEAFHVNLTNASGASIVDAQGRGTIRNDDK